MEEPISQIEQYGIRSGGIIAGKQHDEVPQRPQYSMPGILHFLQTEWARFEMDRAQWEVDRAELQVGILLVLLLVELIEISQQCENYGNIFVYCRQS